MADELVDIFDEDMTFLGTAMKSQAHREGLWHKTFHCWLARRTPDEKILLWLQQRTPNKEIFPNKFDVSAAGHIRAGEEVKDGYREIQEELGLQLNKNDIVKLFTSKEIYDDGGIHNREFQMVYFTMVDVSPHDAVLQPEEVAGLYEVEINDFIDLLTGKYQSVEIEGIKRNQNSSSTLEHRRITRDDIAGHSTEYFIKAAEMVKRYVENAK